MHSPVHHTTAPAPHPAFVPQPAKAVSRHAIIVPRIIAGAIAAMGALVLLGWGLGVASLRSLGSSGRASVNPTTAVAFVGISIAIWLLAGSPRPREVLVARALALAVIALGASRLLDAMIGLGWGIDSLLFHDALALMGDGQLNRMRIAAGANFVLIGSALLLLPRGVKAREALSQVLCIVAFALAQVALLGHMYQSGWIQTIGEFNHMPLPTALAFALLSVGAIWLRHDSGVLAVAFSEGPGGKLARGLLPAGFLAPSIIGGLAIWALRAELGMSDPIKPELVVMLFVLATIIVFVGLIAWNATQLHESHSERARADEALRDSEIRFRLLAENGSDVVSLYDLSGRVIYASPSCERVLGFSPEEVMRMGPFAMVHPDDSVRLRQHFDALIRGEPVTAISCRTIHKTGKYLWLEMMWRAVVNRDGAVVRLQASSRDVTERSEYARQLEEARSKLQEQQGELIEANLGLKALATVDSLTKLKNRRAFEERLIDEISRAKRSGRPLSLLLLDIDHFKSFNDSFGHPRGDEVLRNVANLLARTIRDTDFASRYGGEEFAIILADSDRDGALRMGERLREAIEQAPWTERAITISVGAATLSHDFGTIDELIDHADRAMYRSKELGRNLVTMAA